MNWGLMISPGQNQDATTQQLEVPIDTGEEPLAAHTTELLNRMRPAFDTTTAGLNVGGATPTRSALEFAKTVLQTTIDGGTVTDSAGADFAMEQDLRGFNCKRLNGTILITDGLSNEFNPQAMRVAPARAATFRNGPTRVSSARRRCRSR